ncbi:hypothetical protein FB451DRAFT_1373154 [Mycena latifolia]|nr:hypothetical protein FB451DRAFT_1373154 [Mycena latifolia]
MSPAEVCSASTGGRLAAAAQSCVWEYADKGAPSKMAAASGALGVSASGEHRGREELGEHVAGEGVNGSIYLLQWLKWLGQGLGPSEKPVSAGLYQTRGKWEFDHCCIGLYQAGCDEEQATKRRRLVSAHGIVRFVGWLSQRRISGEGVDLTKELSTLQPILYREYDLGGKGKGVKERGRGINAPLSAPPLSRTTAALPRCPACFPSNAGGSLPLSASTSTRALKKKIQGSCKAVGVTAHESILPMRNGNGSHTMESNQKDERDEGQKEVSTSESGHEVRSSEQRGQDEFVISVSDENLHPVGSLGHHIRAAHIATRSHQAQMLPAKTAERDVGTSATGRYKLETSMYRVPEA